MVLFTGKKIIILKKGGNTLANYMSELEIFIFC